MLPVILDYAFVNQDGHEFFVEIEIYETQNLEMFPEGVSATFRLFKRIDETRELIYLIDNHAPYGFHEHEKLPKDHESRKLLHTGNWEDAWRKFQAKCRRY